MTRIGAKAAHRSGLVGLVTSAVVVAATALAPAASADEGGSFVSYIASARACAGLPGYSTSPDLTAVAAGWAAHLASSGVLAHNPDIRTQVHGWRYVGENVGVGPAAANINTAFWNSAPHKANILDHDYTQVGVATATGQGRLWVVEVFRQPTGSRPAPAPAPRCATPAPSPTPTPTSTPSATLSAAPSASPAPSTTLSAAPSASPAPSTTLSAAPATPSPAATATPTPDVAARRTAAVARRGGSSRR